MSTEEQIRAKETDDQKKMDEKGLNHLPDQHDKTNKLINLSVSST